MSTAAYRRASTLSADSSQSKHLFTSDSTDVGGEHAAGEDQVPERAARRLRELRLAGGREDVPQVRREAIDLADVLAHLDVRELIDRVDASESTPQIRRVDQTQDAAVEVAHVPRERLRGLIPRLRLDVLAEGDAHEAARATRDPRESARPVLAACAAAAAFDAVFAKEAKRAAACVGEAIGQSNVLPVKR